MIQYTKIEFSSDNCSQLLAISPGGNLTTFLLKGQVAPATLKSDYIDTKSIIMQEDKPMILIPYYEVNFNHFLIEEKYSGFKDQRDEIPLRM